MQADKRAGKKATAINVIVREFPGLKEINAVDAAGVHPLLIAIGQERYMPFREKVPEEILTIANRVLGSGQTSLAKFMFIAADEDDPSLDTYDIGRYFDHVLARVDWMRDLHFQTKTTIDTLDYSGSGWNSGSKVVIACRGEVRRKLAKEKPTNLSLPPFVHSANMARPGVLALKVDDWKDYTSEKLKIENLSRQLATLDLEGIAMIVLTEDDVFIGQTLNNFVWVTFTRANPSHDIYGVNTKVEHKHWGCEGPLIIDARIKKHHAPPLVKDPKTTAAVDKLFSKGGELYGVI